MPRPKKTEQNEESKLLLPYIKATDIRKNGLYLELYELKTKNQVGEVKLYEVHGDWAIDLTSKTAIPTDELRKNDKTCKYVFLGIGF